MSDEWIFFPCQIGNHKASIFFDHGIRDHIDTLASAQHLLKVQVTFKQPRGDGMPTNEEFKPLMALEDGLGLLGQELASFYVGRITTNGKRSFYIYTSHAKETWEAKLDVLGQGHGYPLTISQQLDERREGYWKELFPTEDDWQVIQDMRVIDALKKEGDDGTEPRVIDHWAFFPSQEKAELFSQWVQGKGYSSVTTSSAEDGRFRVQFVHQGTVQLGDISSHTIVLRRKASEMEGGYDGWETLVCQKSAS